MKCISQGMDVGLGGSLGTDNQFLDWVAHAVPAQADEARFSDIWLDYHFRILSRFLKYSVSNALDQLSIIGFTKQIYSPKMDSHRITLRLTKL